LEDYTHINTKYTIQADRLQRLLEGWLPLAQESNAMYSWGLDAPALEALILAAAPILLDAQSALEAKALLWRAYHHRHEAL
jgi:hypothetical protein